MFYPGELSQVISRMENDGLKCRKSPHLLLGDLSKCQESRMKLRCVALRCIVLHCVVLLCCVALCCTALLCCIALCCCVVLRCVALHCIALHCIVLWCCTALCCVALCCLACCAMLPQTSSAFSRLCSRTINMRSAIGIGQIHPCCRSTVLGEVWGLGLGSVACKQTNSPSPLCIKGFCCKLGTAGGPCLSGTWVTPHPACLGPAGCGAPSSYPLPEAI